MSASFPQPQNSNNNFLRDLIPVEKRKKVYAYYSAVGAVLVIVVAAVALVTQDFPVWLAIASLAYNLAGPPFGALANANATDNEVQS